MRDAGTVVPVFVFDPSIYKGKHASANRNRFLLECLDDLKNSLKKLGGDLVIRKGEPSDVLHALASETGASAVYCTEDYSPKAKRRDDKVTKRLQASDVTLDMFPGRLIVDSFDNILTKAGTPHKVFTPFWKNWQQINRRSLAPAPTHLQLPAGVNVGELPKIAEISQEDELSPNVIPGGESEARKRLEHFLTENVHEYHKNNNNNMAADQTSRLSAYLHFGCLSPREIETMLPDSEGAAAWHRQLAWRDFYHYVLFHHPSNSTLEFQEKYRSFEWENDETHYQAWREGQTGYPIVDAAMRQLNSEGWMHNRGRLIVGSFLTKDLLLDWRLGEAYFMRMLIDGDQANNNGNWQWIASVGVDPAPVYRRLYNPSSQRDNYDPTGAYVRRYVHELQNVPDEYLSQPWTMPLEVQQQADCMIGKDYPEPIVDHKQARELALERYRLAG